LALTVGRRYWTDYPVILAGDRDNQRAPIRRVCLISRDHEKWVTAETEDGVRFEVKRAYLHRKKRGVRR
jgi:hypothetical protein